MSKKFIKVSTSGKYGTNTTNITLSPLQKLKYFTPSQNVDLYSLFRRYMTNFVHISQVVVLAASLGRLRLRFHNTACKYREKNSWASFAGEPTEAGRHPQLRRGDHRPQKLCHHQVSGYFKKYIYILIDWVFSFILLKLKRQLLLIMSFQFLGMYRTSYILYHSIHQCYGSKNIEFGSGSRILA